MIAYELSPPIPMNIILIPVNASDKPIFFTKLFNIRTNY